MTLVGRVCPGNAARIELDAEGPLVSTHGADARLVPTMVALIKALFGLVPLGLLLALLGAIAPPGR